MTTHKIGIHTTTIQHEVTYAEMIRLCSVLGYSKRKQNDFLYLKSYSSQEEDSSRNLGEKCFTLSHPGIKKFNAYNCPMYSTVAKRHYSKYYIYLSIEPLTVIQKVQHIDLFDMSDESNWKLEEEFRTTIRDLFQLQKDDYGLAELNTWTAKRVDYSVDVRMKNPETTVAFLNLCKKSVVSNHYTESKYNGYGESFHDKGLLFGNKTWEINIYNKPQEIEEKFNDIDAVTRQRLLDESKNLVRIEYRCLKRKTEALARKEMDGRSIMNFLNPKLAHDVLLDRYEKSIGFEDFYTKYHAEKKLAEAFPLPKRKSKKAEGQKHKSKYQKHLDFITYIARHKGIDNAYKAYTAGLHGKELRAAKERFFDCIHRIRQKAEISPVLLTDTWKYRKGMKLPTDFLPNPLREYRELSTRQ